LDLMNERAQVTDAWRQVAVAANALLGTFNVQYHLDSFTPLGQAKPLAFGGSRNRHQLILTGDLPLVRKAERNNYRSTLIAYQRQRRALQSAEDLAAAAVRADIRQLRLLAENYTIQKQAVELAYPQVDSSKETLFGPPDPAQRSTAASQAALTTQYLNAQA